MKLFWDEALLPKTLKMTAVGSPTRALREFGKQSPAVTERIPGLCDSQRDPLLFKEEHLNLNFMETLAKSQFKMIDFPVSFYN